MRADTIVAQEAMLNGSGPAAPAGSARPQPTHAITAVASERARRATLRATQAVATEGNPR
jgi:hypothetical protein